MWYAPQAAHTITKETYCSTEKKSWSSMPWYILVHKRVKGLRRGRHPVCNGQENSHRGTSSMWLSYQPARWSGGSATTKQLTWLTDMKLTEWQAMWGCDRKASSNAVHVQDGSLRTPGVAWLLLGLRDGAGGGLGVLGWRGRGVYINPSHSDSWHCSLLL